MKRPARIAPALIPLAALLWCLSLRAAPLPVGGELNVLSEPEGAEVLINREARGNTPITLGALPPGEYLVSVRQDGYRAEQRSVHVEEGGRRSLSVRLEPLTGLLLVRSSPEGAEVTIDGADHGQTPALITSLPLGRYRVRVATPGYQPKEIEVQLTDRTPRLAAVDLTSDSGTLTVVSEPTGAAVLINGIARGTTPCTVDRIPEGEIDVVVRLDSWQPFQRRVRLAAGELQTLNVPLAPQPAVLRVVSIPDRVRVYFDNEFRGETPLVIEGITPGAHRVRVELAGHDPAARDVTLQQGDNKTEEFRLQANTGRCEVTTDPVGASVFIDGQPRGVTAATPGEAARVSAPLAIEALSDGDHELRIVRKGYFEKAQRIAVQRGRTTTLHVSLERRFIPDHEVTTARGVYRGVLDSITDETLRLETAPGIIATFPIKDVRSHRPLNGEPAP